MISKNAFSRSLNFFWKEPFDCFWHFKILVTFHIVIYTLEYLLLLDCFWHFKILVNHTCCLDKNLKASWKCLAAKCINNTVLSRELKLSRKAFWKLVRNFWREKCAFLRGKYFRRLGPDSLVFRDIGVDIKRVELAILPSIQAQCLPI